MQLVIGKIRIVLSDIDKTRKTVPGTVAVSKLVVITRSRYFHLHRLSMKLLQFQFPPLKTSLLLFSISPL